MKRSIGFCRLHTGIGVVVVGVMACALLSRGAMNPVEPPSDSPTVPAVEPPGAKIDLSAQSRYNDADPALRREESRTEPAGGVRSGEEVGPKYEFIYLDPLCFERMQDYQVADLARDVCLAYSGDPTGSGSKSLGRGCSFTCPGEASSEDEGDCGGTTNGPQYDDDYTNGGCAAYPDYTSNGPKFTTITCEETICGRSAVNNVTGDVYRDTDWYELVLTQETLVTVQLTAMFDMVFGIINNGGTGSCDDIRAAGGSAFVTGAVLTDEEPDECYRDEIAACLDAGTWWIFVAPSCSLGQDINTNCNAEFEYALRVDACDSPCSVGCCLRAANGTYECEDTTDGECVIDLGVSYRSESNCTIVDCEPSCSSATEVDFDIDGYWWTEGDNSSNGDRPSPYPSCTSGRRAIGAVWYSFQAEAESVQVTTCASVGSQDSIISLYAGDCPDGLVEIACSDDFDFFGACGLGSELCVGGLAEGATYYVQLSSWDEDSRAAYRIDITCPCPDLAPAACCLSDGSCVAAAPGPCEALGGYGYLWDSERQCSGDENSNGIDDTCDDAAGACCDDATTNCVPTTHDYCMTLEGVDFLPALRCEQDSNPCEAYACCTSNGCTDERSHHCWDSGETWYFHEHCNTLFACPDEICDLDGQSDQCQSPSFDGLVSSVAGVASDVNANMGITTNGNQVADDFVVTTNGTITEVCWWGLYYDFEANGACLPDFEDESFTITFYRDDCDGCPGVIAETFTVTSNGGDLDRTYTAVRLFEEDCDQLRVWQYHADLGIDGVDVDAGERFWIEIVHEDTGTGGTADDCIWFWETSDEGNGHCARADGTGATANSYDCDEPTTWRDLDLAFCLDVGNQLSPTPCSASAVRSLRPHGAAGELSLDMGTSGGIEPRWKKLPYSAGLVKLEVDLDDAFHFNDCVSVDCDPAWTGTVTASGPVSNTVTLEFDPPLPDESYCGITLSCGAEICVRSCEGDANRDGSTTLVDANAVKLRYPQPVTDDNCEWDVNSDGDINPDDFAGIKLRIGRSAPDCP